MLPGVWFSESFSCVLCDIVSDESRVFGLIGNIIVGRKSLSPPSTVHDVIRMMGYPLTNEDHDLCVSFSPVTALDDTVLADTTF